MQINYKPAQLHKNSAYWYIDYYLQNPNTGAEERFIVKKGLNSKRLKDNPENRLKSAKNIEADINSMLAKGEINPWADHGPQKPEYTILQALEAVLPIRQGKVEESSFNTYKITYNFFVEGIKELGFANVKVKDFDDLYASKVLNYLVIKHPCSNARYNDHRTFMSTFFAVMVKQKMIPQNPFFYIDIKKREEPTKFNPPTDDEQTKINNHLFNNHKPLFIYKSLVYAVGARPGKEVLNLKPDDIDFANNIITIRREFVKAGRKNKILLLDPGLAVLLKEHIQGAQPGWYIFSRGLLPGPKKLCRNTPTNHWKEVVKVGMKINRNMYGQKHRRTDELIMADVDLKHIQQMFGHKNPRTTEEYASTLKQHAQKEILRKGPSVMGNIQQGPAE